MKPVLGMVGGTLAGLALLVSLSAYGVRAYSAHSRQASVPFEGIAVAATEAVKSDTVAAAASATSKEDFSQEDFDRLIRARERKIVGQLGLTIQQQREYDALYSEQTTRTLVFRTRRPYRPEEGRELNAWWNTSIQRVFTPEQYALYLRLWSRGPGSVAISPARSATQ